MWPDMDDAPCDIAFQPGESSTSSFEPFGPLVAGYANQVTRNVGLIARTEPGFDAVCRLRINTMRYEPTRKSCGRSVVAVVVSFGITICNCIVHMRPGSGWGTQLVPS